MTDYGFMIGEFQCVLIKDGGSERAATTFLPTAPPEELEQIVRAQGVDPAAVPSTISPMVIQGKEIILVDTGLGGERSTLPSQLEDCGIYPTQVDTIIITHGHWDHVGGILDANGEFVYPNANYVFWQSEWDYWTADERFAGENAMPGKTTWDTLKAHPDKIRLIGGGNPAEAEIMPGVCAVAAPGHTIGHIAVELTSGDDRLLHIADAAHHWFQAQCPQWSPNFDYDKQQAADTRRDIFERAAREGLLLSAYHFPFPPVGRVVQGDGKLNWEQRG